MINDLMKSSCARACATVLRPNPMKCDRFTAISGVYDGEIASRLCHCWFSVEGKPGALGGEESIYFSPWPYVSEICSRPWFFYSHLVPYPRFIIAVQTTNTGVSHTTSVSYIVYRLHRPWTHGDGSHTCKQWEGGSCVRPVLYVGFSLYPVLLL